MIQKAATALFALGLMLGSGETATGKTFDVSAASFEESVNAAISLAQPGDVIRLPAGRFKMSNELIVDRPGLTIRGAGMDKTIFDFSEQKAGPQGLLGTKDQLTLADFAVADTFGNGIKIMGSNGVRVQRVRVSWKTSQTSNGSYGLYPVLTSNVLIEDSDVSGASDAGIYVGQSTNILVRRNSVHGNVAGIEIENCSDADVSTNNARKNSIGILVFNLPDLIKYEGRRTRVYDNDMIDNNLGNFSTKGSIINLMPSGVGAFILAGKQVEIFDNRILKNHLTGIAMGNYFSSGRQIKDTRYDPMPKAIHIFSNTISRSTIFPNDLNKFTVVMKLLFGLRAPEIVTDGVDDGTYMGEPALPADRICIYANRTEKGKPSKFGNMHLDHQQQGLPFPGGPATRDLGEHLCQLARLSPVKLERLGPIPPGPTPPTTRETLAACKSTLAKGHINRRAFDYDCPLLQDYGLFSSASDARSNPNENGFIYDLNNTLFTDYADKARFVFVPAGQAITFSDTTEFEFPVGTLIAKTFSLNLKNAAKKIESRQIETRILYRAANGWVARNYIWNGSKAELSYGGKVTHLETFPVGYPKGLTVDYHVPNTRECASCHSLGDKIQPIGLKARFMNWNYPAQPIAKTDPNQLRRLSDAGLLAGLPGDIKSVERSASWWDASEPSLEARVQGYLDINCAHCHNPAGNARNTGLFLGHEFDPKTVQFGVCKTPVAAGIGSGGRSFAIQPGSAKDSIIPYRLSQSHLAVKMPQLGRSVTHAEGLKLVQDWIDALPAAKCTN